MTVNVEQAIRDYLPGVRHLSLGTRDESGAPWVSELDFVFRDDLTLCVRSLAARRHSQNMARDPRVSGTIVRQHPFVVGSVEGVSFAGSAALLGAGPEQDEFAELFVRRLGAQPNIVQRAAEEGPQFYRIDVGTWYLYGAPEGGRPQTYTVPGSAS